MRTLLKNYFGYDDFRPLQEEIITQVLAKKDALVVMPTGGGKSLCYQLPALKLSGLTLVISPLIALMKDQVDGLKANGIPAALLNSSLDAEEIAQVQQAVQQGKIKLLYVAPERLGIASFRQFLLRLDVSLIAIDEAHCISEWGHDFRPDYRNLKRLREDFPGTAIIALTATATQKVRKDIIDQLGLHEAETFLLSFNRPNLTYLIKPKKKALEQLIYLLQKNTGESAIIYCYSRKNTETVAEALQQNNLKAVAYHAGLEATKRRTTQEQFIRDEIPIIVATIAFGMGINKPNVRLVVHFDLPKSLEGYYQETGRAGRDGLPSECVLFYSYGDKIKQDFFIEQIEDEEEQRGARKKLAQVLEFCELQHCRRAFLLNYFGEKWPEESCGACDVCLTENENFDATEIVYKILSAIIRTDERFGVNYVVDILRGKSNKKILEQGHENLSVFGIAKALKDEELKQFIKLLIGQNILEKSPGEYPILKVTIKGKTLLKARQQIFLARPVQKEEDFAPKSHEIQQKTALSYDTELFEELRKLRRKLAEQKGVAPFMIFGDVALREMAYYFPQSLESFGGITGVGKLKLTEYGEIFLDVICAYAKERGLSEKAIPFKQERKKSTTSLVQKSKLDQDSTYEQTKRLFLQKWPLEKIAQQRGFALGTILNHLEKIIAQEALDVDYLKPPAERFEVIKEAFTKSDGMQLGPVRAILGENFSYDELRLARIFL